MATLQPGEKARMYALGGLARGGATRGGYVSGMVFLNLDGQHIGFGPDADTAKTIIDSLSITDTLDEAPNTCRFRVHGSVPQTGQDIIMTLGSKNRLERLFAGVVLTVTQTYAADNPRWVQGECAAVDWTWLLGFHLVTKKYQAQSATAIAIDLMASYAAMNGFTTNGVEAGLPTLDEFTVTNEDVASTLTRLARRIGAYWKVDYLKDLRFGFDLSLNTNGNPEPLTVAHRSFAHLTRSSDRTQVLTRVYVEGRGSRLLSAVLAGDSMIPLEAVDMFAIAGDVFAKLSFQGSEGGAQHLNYSGVVAGNTGSLVGPGAGPTNAPGLTPQVGAGLSAGTYQYAFTDVTATGETTPSPIGSLTLTSGSVAAPTVKPTEQIMQNPSGAVDIGGHSWAYTYVTGGGGETTLSPLGDYLGNWWQVPTTGGIRDVATYIGGVLPSNRHFAYKCTYVGDLSGETSAAQYGDTVYIDTLGNNKPEPWAGNTTGGLATWARIPEGVTHVKFYRTKAATSQAAIVHNYFYVGTAPVTIVAGYELDRSAKLFDLITDANLGAALPTTGTALAKYQQTRITTSASPSPGVTGVNIYRTKKDTSSPYFLVVHVDVPAGALSYDDIKADAALGGQPPSTNTAGDEYRAVQVNNVAPGPPGTTWRKLYRTVASGTQLKFLVTLLDNTTTNYLDQIGDGSLGANAPTGDTSGLQVPAGQVPAGSTSMLVANAGAFPPAGWVVIGNGEQVIRFTSKGTASLLGIPATGIGSVTAGIAYNSTATAAPMLTGIPTSGMRSIQRALTSGDEIYLVVQCDNVPAQDAIEAALAIADGTREEWVQDRRLSIPEARARGNATLQTRELDQQTLRYTCRDLRTASGKTITVNLPAPTNMQGSYKIQSVTIANFRPYPNQYPTFTVDASSARFSFEDWLRVLRTKD